MPRPRRLLLAGLGLIVAGVLGLALMSALAPPGGATWPAPGRSYGSVGERIFLTGRGSDGPIPFEGGPFWLSMHGGGCAACHGADGRGGRPVMMLGIVPPDIRYSTLVSQGYNDGLIARAIASGLHEDGELLDPAMPRWRMSSPDLTELIAYLKTLR